MIAVNGYFDGNVCVALDTSHFKPRQRLIITALDEEYGEMQEKKAALEELHSVFGAMTHEEAEEIRNNRLTIRERF